MPISIIDFATNTVIPCFSVDYLFPTLAINAAFNTISGNKCKGEGGLHL
jgi:hypothetical protein